MGGRIMLDGKIFVTRRLHQDAIDMLEKTFSEVDVWNGNLPPTPFELLKRSKGCIGLITAVTEKIDGAFLDKVPSIKVVSNIATGFDNFDLPAASLRGVLMTNTPGILEETTADLTFTLILSIARRILEANKDATLGFWGPWDPHKWLGQDIHHQTLGIVGLGRIGRQVAKRAKGFDMKVLYTARRRHQEAEIDMGLYYAETLQALLEWSDFVSLHVPLTADTYHMIDATAIASMKPTAYIINTSRGEIIDQPALIKALNRGEISGAALDVMTPEPLPPDHSLYTMRNVVITPHIGSATWATRRSMAMLAAENVIAACKGEPVRGALN